jgi:hypothetical protein
MKRALAERVKQEMGDPMIPPSAPPSSSLRYIGMNGVGNCSVEELSGNPSKIPRTNLTLSTSSLLMTPASASPRDSSQIINIGEGISREEMVVDSHSVAAAAVAGATMSKKRPRSPPNAISSGNTAAFQSSSLMMSSIGENNDDDAAATTTATPKNRGPGRPRKSSSSATTMQETESTDDDDADNSGFYLKLQNASLASELYAYRRRIYLLEREREYRRRECRVARRKLGELDGAWRGMECALGKELEANDLRKKVCACDFIVQLL